MCVNLRSFSTLMTLNFHFAPLNSVSLHKNSGRTEAKTGGVAGLSPLALHVQLSHWAPSIFSRSRRLFYKGKIGLVTMRRCTRLRVIITQDCDAVNCRHEPRQHLTLICLLSFCPVSRTHRFLASWSHNDGSHKAPRRKVAPWRC